MRILLAAASIMVGSGAQAQEVEWPADLKASLEGVWLNERDARSIEIRGGNVVVRTVSERRDIFSDALNRQIATIGEFDRSKDSPSRRYFNATCTNDSTGWEPRPCTGSINRVANSTHSVMDFVMGVFHPINAKTSSSSATATTGNATPSPAKPAAASSRYVEVAGPDGPIRLSPEVAARNQAAADEYRRKMDEFARAKAEHERTLALHQQSQANAAAEQRDYQQKLAMNDTQVAAHGAAMAQHVAATKPPAKGAKGWMYCEAIGEIGGKSRYYSTIAEVDYVPGEITIIDVMAKNRAAFKAYLAGTHKVFFGTDTLLHCPYSTDDLAEAQGYEARDKRGDGNNGIVSIQTGWAPTS